MKGPSRGKTTLVTFVAFIAFTAAAAAAASATVAEPRREAPDRFQHAKHARLFPRCETCHAGAATGGAPMWPDPVSCGACHNGTVRPAVDWSPPAKTPGSLRFDHAVHATRLAQKGTLPTQCNDCHADRGSERMEVHRTRSARCFECHTGGEHFSEQSECATCHFPLSQALQLTEQQIAAFPKPPSHDVSGFALAGHSKAACPGGGTSKAGKPTSSNCAVCHAQQFCETCHVNAAELECISSLGSDARSLVLPVKDRTPPSHANTAFLMSHGHGLDDAKAECGTCHTQSSCRVCHAATPGVANALLAAAPRPGVGAGVERKRPPSHGEDFRKIHGALASSDPTSCAACHHRAQCLDCHRSDPAAENPGYHPAGFLARHPAAAYARETSCADCHNPGSFCQSCHESAGLNSATSILGSGFHDAKQSFVVGHGPAARMSLESCVSCHTESDCLLCHSDQGGRGFNPHGPDFNAAKLREKAPQMCTVCHGLAIPK